MAHFATYAGLAWLGFNAAFVCVRLWATRSADRAPPSGIAANDNTHLQRSNFAQL